MLRLRKLIISQVINNLLCVLNYKVPCSAQNIFTPVTVLKGFSKVHITSYFFLSLQIYLKTALTFYIFSKLRPSYFPWFEKLSVSWRVWMTSSTLRNFPHLVASTLFLNTAFSAAFSNTLHLYSSFSARDKVSRHFKAVSIIRVLCTLIFSLLIGDRKKSELNDRKWALYLIWSLFLLNYGLFTVASKYFNFPTFSKGVLNISIL